MTKHKEESELKGTSEASCDVKIWAGACQHSDYRAEGDEYLCSLCGKIIGLTHEVRHEGFPYISGDEDNLS